MEGHIWSLHPLAPCGASDRESMVCGAAAPVTLLHSDTKGWLSAAVPSWQASRSWRTWPAVPWSRGRAGYSLHPGFVVTPAPGSGQCCPTAAPAPGWLQEQQPSMLCLASVLCCARQKLPSAGLSLVRVSTNRSSPLWVS